MSGSACEHLLNFMPRSLLRDNPAFFKPDFQRHIRILWREMPVRIRPTTEQLLTNRIALREDFVWDGHVILRTEPAITVSVEKSFPRNMRVVFAAGVPKSPVKKDGVAGLRTDRHSVLRKRPIARAFDPKYLDRFNSIFSLDVEPVFLRLTPHKGSTSGRSDYGNNLVLLLITNMTARNNIEIATSRLRTIRKPVDDFQ